jgi:hypothetical protein
MAGGKEFSGASMKGLMYFPRLLLQAMLQADAERALTR